MVWPGYRHYIIEELIDTKNSTQFWSNLKFLSNQGNFSNNSNIPVDKLYNHFQQLHSVPDTDSLSYTQENIVENLKDKVTQSIQFNNLDQPFTEDEIRASVKSLKNKKITRS